MTEMNPVSPVLEIRGLTKYLGNRRILDDINLQVNHGEIFGFLGPNGSGKTTTIKLILGLLRIDQGEIKICGHDVRKDFEGAIRNVGGIIENPEMYKYLSGRENLMQYLRMYDDVDVTRVDEVVKIVRMEGRIGDKISKFSLGMKQRLGIAQAILHKPELLVLDEPTNGLDPAGIKDLRDIFKKLAHEENCAVFVSSHMLAELELMCDRVCVIDRGRVISDMTMADIHDSKNNDSVKYSLEADNTEKAVEIISAMGISAQIDRGTVVFVTSHDNVPSVISSLVREGIAVYGLTHESKSLEQAFMEITDVNGGVGL